MSQPTVIADEGEEAVLACTADGNPSPVIMWTSPSNTTITSDGTKYIIEMVEQTSTLTISSVAPSDEGVYTCSVVNAHGSDKAEIELMVYSK